MELGPWFSNLNHQEGRTHAWVVPGPSPDFLLSFFSQSLLSSVEKVEHWLDSEEASLASEGPAVGTQQEWGRMDESPPEPSSSLGQGLPHG